MRISDWCSDVCASDLHAHDPRVDRGRMFNLERGGDAVATLRQPQHVDEADRVRSGRGRNGVWKALEASLSKRAASVKSTAVIGGDPHIVTEDRKSVV